MAETRITIKFDRNLDLFELGELAEIMNNFANKISCEVDFVRKAEKPTSEPAKALDLLEVVPCCYEIDFDGNLKTKIEIKDNVPTVIATVNGWGQSVNVEATIITQLQ
jgi:hypothetical protein